MPHSRKSFTIWLELGKGWGRATIMDRPREGVWRWLSWFIRRGWWSAKVQGTGKGQGSGVICIRLPKAFDM
jgi:hypothetical protein